MEAIGSGVAIALFSRPVVIALLLLAAGTVLLADGLVTGDDDPYAEDQCTAWAYAKRPDLTSGTRGLDAADWESWARENGYRVDSRPEPGDVVVWMRNAGASDLGHVAYVEDVTPAGEVIVSERNRQGCGRLEVGALSPERRSTAFFIHRRR